MATRNDIVKQAQAWLGRKESNGTHKYIIDIYNAHKPLARGYKVKYTDEWCATFVSAVFIACKATDIFTTECSCTKIIENLKALGAWVESDSYTPKAGDLILYDWEDSGKGENTNRPNHIGIVEKVSGKTITVIEGNYKQSVKRRTIKVNGKYIRGFGVPKYAEETFKVGDKVKLTKDATIYGSKKRFSAWVYLMTLYVREVAGARVVVSTKKSGAVTGAVNRKHLVKK
jgi:hypothetical protein